MARKGQNRRAFGRYSSSGDTFEPIRYEDLQGGLNNNSSPMNIDDNQSPDLLNTIFEERGAVSNRKGIIAIGDEFPAPAGVQGMFSAAKDGQTYLLVAMGGKVFSTDETGVRTQIHTLGSTTSRVEFAQLLGAVYIAEEGVLLKKWDFAAISTPTGAKKLRDLIRWQNGLWGISDGTNGSGDNASRVWYTAALADDISDNFIDIEKQDGDELMTFRVRGKILVTWKTGSTHKLFYDDTFTTLFRETVDDTNGCIARRSVHAYKSDYIFLSRNGLRQTKTQYFLDEIKTDRLDQEITPLINQINQRYAEFACGGFYRNRYQLWYPVSDSTVPTQGVVIDDRYEKWFRWDNWTPSVFCRYVGSDKVERYYMGDATKGQIYELDNGYNDAGEAYSSYYKTKMFDLGANNVYKLLRWLDLFLKNVRGSVTLNIYLDEELFLSETIKTGKSLTTGSSGMGRHTLGYKTRGRSLGSVERFREYLTKYVSIGRDGEAGRARHIQLEIRSDAKDERWTLLGFNFHARAEDGYRDEGDIQ